MKIYTTICFLSLINLFSFGQEGKPFCDATFGKAERSTGNLPLLTTLPTTLELDEFQICGGGKFRVIYMDVINNTGEGFDDNNQTLVEARKNCVCNVLNYLESVIQIPSAIGLTSPTIDIVFLNSNQLPNSLLGQAMPIGDAGFYSNPPTIASGYYGGYVHQYITTGIKPDINSEDAQVSINFENSSGSPYDYLYCSEENEIEDCQIDFYGLILHELTHTLGFLSLTNQVNGNITSYFTGTSAFSLFDKHFLFFDNGSATFEKIIDIVNFAATGGINPNALTSGTSNKVWLKDETFNVNKQNHPINSQVNFIQGTSLCHLDRLYIERTAESPGFSPNYVMNGYLYQHEKRHSFTIEELEILETLGYTIQPPYNLNITNNTPFHSGKLITNLNSLNSGYMNTTPASGLPDLSIVTNNDNPVILDLTNGTMTNGTVIQSLNFIDLDGDDIRVFYPDPIGNPSDKGIYNIRGCGINGNNSNALSINPNQNIITFTPRNNFIGRAQFGFHLFDGIQRGDYVVITIDVERGNSFINTPINELVINGNFEEGCEINDLGNKKNLNVENIDISPQYLGVNLLPVGTPNQSKNIADAVQYVSPNWNRIYIRNSSLLCYFNNYCFDNCSGGIAIPGPLPTNNTGDRYMSFNSNSNSCQYFNMTLAEPLEPCNYKVEFDLFIPSNAVISSNSKLNFLFHSLGINENTTPTSTDVLENFYFDLSGYQTGTWVHLIQTFTYDAAIPANFFQIHPTDIVAGLDIDNISISRNNTINLVASNNPICNGASTNITASGLSLSNFVWSPTNTLNSSTGTTVIASPTSPTTYSVTSSFENGCTLIGDITIDINPTPTLNTIQNQTVCANTNASVVDFTGAPTGTTYSWTNTNTAIGLAASGSGTAIPSFVAQNTTNSPITSIISVIPSLNGCLGNSTNFTITVNPVPNITISPSNVTISQGNSTLLSASGGLSYTWTPATNLSCTTCPVTTANPSTTTTYTVSGTANGGCQSTATTTVNVENIIACTTCSNSLSGNLTGNPIGGRSYCVNNNLTITGNSTITASELRIASNVSITVNAGVTLTIRGSHLYACGDMWNGIVVKPGGRVVVEDGVYLYSLFPVLSSTFNSIIEDAKIAIKIESNSPLTTNILKVTNTIFNRNGIGIQINDYTLNIATYPFEVNNSIFTCRAIPFGTFNPQNENSWAKITTVRGTAPNPNNSYGNVYINNTTYAQTGTNAHLKAPMLTQKSSVGLELNNVGLSSNVSTSPAYREFTLGNVANMNIFDNHQKCVNLISSNFTSINTVFQNTSSKGYGIYAISDDTKNMRLQVLSVVLDAGGNRFVDCKTAIYTRNYFEHNIQYSDVRTTQYTPDLSSYKYGFNIQTNRNRVSAINFNKIYNVENGIVFNETSGVLNIPGITATYGQYAGNVSINFNTLKPALSGTGGNTRHLTNAIVLQNSGSITHQVNNVAPIIGTNSNTILASRGIQYLNWIKQNTQIQNNTITLREHPNLFVGAPYFGISVNNSTEGSGNGNFIRSNSVTGFYIPSVGTNTSNDPNLKGIVQAFSGKFAVTCNTTSQTTRGIEFSGPNYNTLFKNNTMSQHRYGFVLDNTGIIGTQGTAPSPADNQWTGTWLSENFKTATLGGSSAQNSKMYVRDLSNYNPDGSSNIANLNLTYSTLAVPPTLLVQSNPFVPLFACFQILPWPGIKKNLELVVQDSITNENWSETVRYISKNLVFRNIKEDLSLKDSSAVLDDFFNTSLFSVREQLYNIEEKLSNENFFQGILDNQVFVPENTIEENYKNYFNVLSRLLQSAYTSSDSLNLFKLAEKCPFTEGQVIYQARALYNIINDTSITFEDVCESGEQRDSKVQDIVETELYNDVVVYPNPTQQKLNILFTETDLLFIEITVRDVNGKIVYASKQLKNVHGLSTIDLDVENGVYLIEVINPNNDERFIKKILIQTH